MEQMTASRPFIATLLAVVILDAAHGQPGPDPNRSARVAGRLLYRDGAPLQHQTIAFRNMMVSQRPENNVFEKVETNGAGEFSFWGRDHTLYGIGLMLTPQMYKEFATIDLAEREMLQLGDIIEGPSPALGTMIHVAGPVRQEARSSLPRRLEEGESFAGVYTLCSDEAAEVCFRFALHLVQASGGEFTLPQEKGAVGVSYAMLAPDNRAVGWLVNSQFCCTSYPLAFTLVVYRPGEPLRRFSGDHRSIFGWRFLENGRQVAFYQSYPHGDLRKHYELRDVEIGRLLERWDEDSTDKMPAWVRALTGSM
jgi:hypothetical protein